MQAFTKSSYLLSYIQLWISASFYRFRQFPDVLLSFLLIKTLFPDLASILPPILCCDRLLFHLKQALHGFCPPLSPLNKRCSAHYNLLPTYGWIFYTKIVRIFLSLLAQPSLFLPVLLPKHLPVFCLFWCHLSASSPYCCLWHSFSQLLFSSLSNELPCCHFQMSSGGRCL